MNMNEHANKEYFTRLEQLVGRVREVDGLMVLDVAHPAIVLSEGKENLISIADLDGLVDLYRKPEQHALYNMINRFFIVFLGKEFRYHLDIPTITSFEFKVKDDLVCMSFDTLKDGRYAEGVKLVGKSDRLYLARLLSGLSPAVNVSQCATSDYVFSFKDRTLLLQELNEPTGDESGDATEHGT